MAKLEYPDCIKIKSVYVFLHCKCFDSKFHMYLMGNISSDKILCFLHLFTVNFTQMKIVTYFKCRNSHFYEFLCRFLCNDLQCKDLWAYILHIFSLNNIQIHFKQLINLHVKIKTPKLKCKYEVEKRDMKDTFSRTETIVQMES